MQQNIVNATLYRQRYLIGSPAITDQLFILIHSSSDIFFFKLKIQFVLFTSTLLRKSVADMNLLLPHKFYQQVPTRLSDTV